MPRRHHRSELHAVSAMVELLEVRRVLSSAPVVAAAETSVDLAATQTPSIALDKSGDAVAVWENTGQDGSQPGIYAQLFNSAGTAEGSKFRVSTDTVGQSVQPMVVMDAAGDFVVTWLNVNQNGTESGIDARRFNVAGTPLGSEFRVNADTTDNLNSPSIAIDGSGDFVIVWVNQNLDSGNSSVYVKPYNASGVAETGEFQVNPSSSPNESHPFVAMDAAGNFVVTRESINPVSGLSGIYAQRYEAGGTAEGSEFSVRSDPAGNQVSSSVAMDAGGDFVITWQSGQAGLYGIFAQRFNSAGAPQGTEIPVDSNATLSRITPSVAMGIDGGFIVTWQSEFPGGLFGVIAQRFDSAGNPLGAELAVNESSANSQQLPVVAIDGAGDFVVAWESQSQDSNGYGIYAQRFGASGVAAAGDFEVNPVAIPTALISPSELELPPGVTGTGVSDIQNGNFNNNTGQLFNAFGFGFGGDFQFSMDAVWISFAPWMAFDAGYRFM